ncbi:MAG: methyltransferase domain-containing protein [Promethearchaeota archaeon]|nr:MAG: methyltransferase domain-containing protein [Candidatus Lokiarchaeota archaeon]
MRKLELEPDSYESNFTILTKGANVKVYNWILERINNQNSILEIGCGTGTLAAKMALKGNDVLAIDKNQRMITTAMKNYPSEPNLNLLYQIGTISDLPVEESSKDIIVSTFMLSELRPYEQQIFLRNSWKALKPNGKLIIAAEFVPSGFWKLLFNIKRWWYKKKLRRLKITSTFLVKWFFNYISPIGFKISNIKKWRNGSIQAIELIKINNDKSGEPGYYQPKFRKFKGFRSQMSIYRCLFTGQTDHVPIEPGLYPSGNPNKDSPIIVTANYVYTYIKVMRALKGVDAWVLCVDSRGINVWCAARGNNFGNKQLIEAVETTGIARITNKKTLIVPQLSAGGIAAPLIKSEAPDFPFNILYGPVWAKHLPKFLEERPARKSDKMKLAKFTLSHRFRAEITHTTFLFRKIFLWPSIILFLLLISITFINPLWISNLWIVGELWLWIIIANALIAILFPITNFTRKFITKGIIFGIINVLLFSGISWLFQNSLFNILLSSLFYFWVAFFSTMSFSGYTMATSPREIQDEYPIFSKTNMILLIIGLVLKAIGFTIFQIF